MHMGKEIVSIGGSFNSPLYSVAGILFVAG